MCSNIRSFRRRAYFLFQYIISLSVFIKFDDIINRHIKLLKGICPQKASKIGMI